VKKRKLTKKERKAQRNAERVARSVPPSWARSEMTYAEREAAFWRDEFGLDVDVIGPALIEKVIERDREWRATDVERSVEAWADYVFSECSECGYLDGHRPNPSFPMTTCMGCGAAMESDRTLSAEAEWIERGPVLAMVDQAESEHVLATLLDDWVEEHVAELRDQADEVEFDLSWGPNDVLEEVQGGALDGVVDNLRVVDWRVVARGVAAWLDEHPRKVDPVDHLQVAGDLLDGV
jgi:hypothetical protein